MEPPAVQPNASSPQSLGVADTASRAAVGPTPAQPGRGVLSQDHHLPKQRFELKYLIEEETALALRGFLASYLQPDEYAACRPDGAYRIDSLYLDSDGLRTHQDSVNGLRNRFKLRLRYYSDRPGAPVYVEVKARADNCILKRRCAVRRKAVPLLLAGHLPPPDEILSSDPRDVATLERFLQRVRLIAARPKAHNCYWREAWVCPNGTSLRVTLDREIHIEPCSRSDLSRCMKRPTRLFEGLVVLEVKFTDRFPRWLTTMVQRFSLMRWSAAKYSGGVVALGEHRFHDGNRVAEALAMPGANLSFEASDTWMTAPERSAACRTGY